MKKSIPKFLLILLIIYGIASFVHFIHNAEFLSEYPNLPTSWSRLGIYVAWLALTIPGIVGWFLLIRGFPRLGLLLLVIYALLGMDSLGHYMLAPISEHTLAMNTTIMSEVTAATLVLVEAIRLMTLHFFHRHNLTNRA